MPVEIKAWFRERSRALDQCVVATLIIAAGAGSWDDLFARALWLPTTLLALVAFRLMDDLASVESDRAKKPVPVHATLTNLAPLRHALGVLALLTLLSTLGISGLARVGSPWADSHQLSHRLHGIS